MPPRRLTRSAQPSVEPPAVTKPPVTAAKRKRPNPTSKQVDDEESEAKPRVGAKPKVNGVGKLSSKQVPETDDDEMLVTEHEAEVQLPPIKRRRPSPSPAPNNGEVEPQDQVKVKRNTSRSAAAVKKGQRPGQKAVSESEDDEPEQEEDDAYEDEAKPKAKATSRTRKSSANPRKSAAPSSRAAPKGKPRAASVKISVSSSREPAAVPREHDDSAELSDENDPAKPQPLSPSKAKARLLMTPRRSTVPSSAEHTPKLRAMSIEDEQEISLLDPPAPPEPPKTQEVPQAHGEEPNGPTSRLVIHKMALVNFKSYAGRQEIGPFHKSFSSIVGPNGSGKSNTIDALLFVFGYRASKMRQGKLSELIHNSGTAENDDGNNENGGRDECTVEVHFREIIDLPGPDAYAVVPNSTLVVARTAYRNNTSRYTINGRGSTFTEVQTLLKGRGIDLDHKRFLILQGEVESIAQMKPKAASEHEEGLLEYLEDIIGTSGYKRPIEEAMASMDAYAEERGEKLNRLRLVEKEKDRLEEGKREAENWLRLKNEHVRAQSRLWQWYLWKCLINEGEFQRKMARIEKELAEETERNRDDIEHHAMLEKHYDEREKAYEEVKTAAEEAIKDLAAHERRSVGLEERRKHATGKAKKLKKSLSDDRRAKDDAARAIDDNSDKMEREKANVDEHEASLEQEEKVLEGIRDSLKDKTQVFHDQIEVKQRELQPWTAKINAKQAEIDVASSERDALAKKAEAVREAGRAATADLEQLSAEKEAKMTELGELKANQAALGRDTQSAARRLQDTQTRVQDLRARATSSRQKVDEAKASQAASTSQNKILETLTKLEAAGRINGFHGRLGSLGTIPDKYDVAVSTACGALNNMVVDTVEQGQACIEYLRRQNIGRASFIVLEKLSQTNGLEKISTPENVPRLFDLIRPKEPRFAPAFFKGVGHTLVAEDLEQANRIAFGGQKRWRVVTLAGQLIDSSGTMSGGGTHISKGGMSSKLAKEGVTPQVLKTYEKESEEAARELEATLQQLRQVEAEVEELHRRGPAIEMALEKIGLDIRTGERRITEAEKRLKELNSQSKPDAGDIARIKTLEANIARSTKELQDLQGKTGQIEEAIKALEKKILDIGGARLLTQKSKVDGIRLHINLANDEITKAEVAKAKAEKDIVKFEHSIQANMASLKEVDGELEELNGQLEECAQYVDELRTKVAAAQGAAENSKDDLENLKAELDAKTEEIQAFRQKEMELQQSLNDTKKEVADNEKALDHWRTQHDALRLEEIDDDDDEDPELPAEPNAAIEGVEGSEAQVVKPEPIDPSLPTGKVKTSSYELHIYTEEELSRLKKKEMVADTELLDEKLKNAKPNLSILKEYRKREQEFLKRAQDLEKITALRDAEKQKYDGLRKQRLDEFMAGFSLISTKLKEMYQMITLGGNAELELVDSMDPFSEGIIFSVMPPKKSWKNISNLSGGEKTLSSLALVFALHVFKPTPLYFMDEIDAALDFRNVSIVANYIKDRTKNAQFIIISLRNDMFELSHRLIGIYKTANATRSISIDNHALHAGPAVA